jgi:hypothetical protein
MTEPLSPAAQAVLDAAAEVYWNRSDMSPASWIPLQYSKIINALASGSLNTTSSTIAAAALRAAAEHVVPTDVDPSGDWTDKDEVRYQLLAIADELEGNHD